MDHSASRAQSADHGPPPHRGPLNEAAQKELTSSEALALLVAGNERFLTGVPIKRNHALSIQATAEGQFPYAVVLGCIDSRVPHELIFDAGIGDLFSVRIAGNFINDDILGSLEFATAISGAKLIVVLGHSECGAVKGACDDVRLGHLTGLLKNLAPAVASTSVRGKRDSSNAEFVQAVAFANVRQSVKDIAAKSPVINELVKTGRATIVGGMHDLATGQVDFLVDPDRD
ncbi:MAG: carbonic anhydrase [Rhodothermales bacterium]|jgi:carbonic anhydrase